jgi:hypothetical protein
MKILVIVRYPKIQKAKARKPNNVILKILLKNLTSPHPPARTGKGGVCEHKSQIAKSSAA